MTPSFIKACELVLKEEGGYVWDKKDPGGETNMGISKRAYPDEDIKNMTKGRAMDIYHRDYWMKIKGDHLPYGIALMVFDCAVNAGVKRSVKILQRAVLAPQDGILGDMTLNALMANPKLHIMELLHEYRMEFYISLPTFTRFGNGWKARTDRVYEEAIDSYTK